VLCPRGEAALECGGTTPLSYPPEAGKPMALPRSQRKTENRKLHLQRKTVLTQPPMKEGPDGHSIVGLFPYQSDATAFGKEQIPETDLVAQQYEDHVENSPYRIDNRSWQECCWKIIDEQQIRKQENSIEDSSYDHNTYIEEIPSDIESGHELQVCKAEEERCNEERIELVRRGAVDTLTRSDQK
jgi:hypothetical protein